MKVRKIITRGWESRTWFLDFRRDGIRQRIAAFTDKAASEELGRKVVRLIAAVGAGMPVEPQLTRWFETMPNRIRDWLRDLGLLGRQATEMARPLRDHLDEWRESLLAGGNTEKHVRDQYHRAKRLLDGSRVWGEITASAVDGRLRQLQAGRLGIGAKTSNYYLQATKQFCRWMVDDRRAYAESPVAHHKPINANGDRHRRRRRAFSAAEIRWLLQAAREAPDRFCMTGRERALLYWLVLETGLRKGEIASLRKRSFDLVGPDFMVTIEAAYSKHRREDVLQLRRDLVEALRRDLANKLPDAPAFSVPTKTAAMIRADLEAARRTWIGEAATPQDGQQRERSDFLRYQDHAGRYADFHALRHTFITNLYRGGVHPKTAQVLARHGTIGLTMEVYTHVDDDQRAALEVLPDLAQAAEGAA